MQTHNTAPNVLMLRTLLSMLGHGAWLLELLADYDWQDTAVEYGGTIDDIMQLCQEEQDLIFHIMNSGLHAPRHTPLEEAGLIWEFINSAQMVCTPEEIETTGKLPIFRLKYPYLYRTFVTWAWG